MNMNMFDVEAGRPIVDRYVISELLDGHLDHIISVHSAVILHSTFLIIPP